LAYKILIVEDEPGLLLFLSDRLTREGYEITSREEGLSGYETAALEHFDIIILDIMLPGKNGLDICRDLRRKNIDTPILMLTARDQVIDKVVGLKLGADDYLTKPFEFIELLARIEALLRRAPAPEFNSAEVYSFGSITVNFPRAEVRKKGKVIDLSAREFRLLCFFIENRSIVISRDELLNRVWGYDSMPQTRTVDVHIGNLRQKIEDNPRKPIFLHTVHGMGYKFLG
jgi:two-component system alkaline phosphatase synthesis response regulator PhoP